MIIRKNYVALRYLYKRFDINVYHRLYFFLQIRNIKTFVEDKAVNYEDFQVTTHSYTLDPKQLTLYTDSHTVTKFDKETQLCQGQQ